MLKVSLRNNGKLTDMSYKGGNRVPFQRTVMNGGDGQTKCLVLLSMIHNLKLHKASLIMTAIKKR